MHILRFRGDGMTSQYEVDKWIEELKKDSKFKSLWEYSEKCENPQIEKIRRKYNKRIDDRLYSG